MILIEVRSRVFILIAYGQFAESVNIEFIHHCEQGRTLLKLVMKHVKACA